MSLENLEGELLFGCCTQVLTEWRTEQAEERPGPAVVFLERPGACQQGVIAVLAPR